MYSQEQVFQFEQQFMTERLEKSIQQIKTELEKNGRQIKEGLLSCTDRLFQKCICQQQEGIKQPIRYIHFFYLNLSVITGKYDIQMNAFSEQSYMDRTETMELWNPKFIMDFYEKDMKDMEKEAKSQILRFGYSQMMEVKARNFIRYAMVAGQYLMNAAGDIASLSSFQEMEKEEGLQMVFGGYMDTGFQIWPASPPKGTERQEEGL